MKLHLDAVITILLSFQKLKRLKIVIIEFNYNVRYVYFEL